MARDCHTGVLHAHPRGRGLSAAIADRGAGAVVAAVIAAALLAACADPSDYPVDADPFAADAAQAAPDGGAPFVGTLVPLYSYPTEPTWAAVAAAAEAHPDAHVVVIANPDSGPGLVFDPHYADGLTLLQAAGVTVIGYVYTSYADRAASLVQEDMDTWILYYPTLDGFFFDEMSADEGDVAYYQDLVTHAGAGAFTVGNPGTASIPAYAGVVDVLVVYETAGLPSAADFTWHADGDPRDFAAIPYAVADPTGLTDLRPVVGYLYATDDDLPNPWDTLPAYFETLLE